MNEKLPDLRDVVERAKSKFKLMYEAASADDPDWEFVFAVRDRALEDVELANTLAKIGEDAD
ncbi:MAG: hypothetical protein ACXABD_19540 [Candidatus Thorarchaeota archaeon]|jgi:hypothetical protein